METDRYTVPQLIGLREAISQRLHRIDNGQDETRPGEEKQLRQQLGQINQALDEKTGQKTLF